ncbi:MAG: T9SS type A sorting domain-containing protein [Bacteroidia bacterium]|nr:T9SS type A sorting domain-containing protein [Bacteroidia bacterium]
MKTKILFALFACFIAAGLKSQTTFQREFFPWSGTASIINPYTFQNTSDGGHIMGGFMGISYISPGSKSFLIKTDLNGDTLWSRNYAVNMAYNSCIYFVNEDLAGNFIACGSVIDSVNGFDYAIFVMKVGANGNVIWSNAYSLSADTTYLERALCVKPAADGGYIVAGDVYNNGYDAFLLKLDNAGNTQWSKVFAGTKNDLFYSVVQTSDGGFAASGETKSFDPNNNPTACLIKTDANGDTLWTKNYETSGTSIAWSLSQTSDGGFIMPVSNYGANTDMGLIKTNASGNSMWAKTYGGSGDEYGYCATELSGGGYALTGTSFSFNDQVSGNYFLAKVNTMGQLVWAKEYGGSGVEEAYVVQEKSNGGLSVFGYSDSWYPTSSSFLVTTDFFGNSTCNDFNINPTETPLVFQTKSSPFNISSGVVKTPRLITVSSGGSFGNSCATTAVAEALPVKAQCNIGPNPCQGSAILSVEEEIYFAELKIYNVTGEVVKIVSAIHKGETRLNLTGLDKGIYFYMLTSKGENVYSGKLMIN